METFGVASASDDLFWMQRALAEGRPVTQWRTPMLVIAGEKDFRVPYTQSLSAFTALQRRGIESRLLVFPDENHWILKPANSIYWYSTVLDWLDSHTRAP